MDIKLFTWQTIFTILFIFGIIWLIRYLFFKKN